MSYGIEIKNTSGNIIIDDTYRNFEVSASGSKVPGNAYPGISGFNLGTDMLMAKPNRVSENFLDIAINYSSTPSWGGDFSSPFTNPNSWSYKVLRPSVTIPGSGYGIEIFNSSGQLCFSSNTLEVFNVMAAGNFRGGFSNNGAIYTSATNTTTLEFSPASYESIEDYYISTANLWFLSIFGGYSYIYARYHYVNNTIYISTNTQVYTSFVIGEFRS